MITLISKLLKKVCLKKLKMEWCGHFYLDERASQLMKWKLIFKRFLIVWWKFKFDYNLKKTGLILEERQNFLKVKI